MEKEILICTKKFMSTYGTREKCVGYEVKDAKDELSTLTPKQLKHAIWDGRVKVLNMTLTSDMKLRQKKYNDTEIEIIYVD